MRYAFNKIRKNIKNALVTGVLYGQMKNHVFMIIIKETGQRAKRNGLKLEQGPIAGKTKAERPRGLQLSDQLPALERDPIPTVIQRSERR